MKKILISALIFSLLWVQISYANSSINTKKLILKKKQIETNIVPGKSYIKRLDKALSKYSDNKVVIWKILNRVALVKTKLKDNEKSLQKKLLLEYIEYKSYTFFPELNTRADETTKDFDANVQKELDEKKALRQQEALDAQRKIERQKAYIEYLNKSNSNLSIDAKNAKTTDIISKVAITLENALISWRNLKNLITIDVVDTDKYSSNFVHSASWSYMVWVPNYSELGISKENILDGYDNELTIWIIASKDKYEVMWVVKKWSEKQVRIMWNFSARDYKFISWVDYEHRLDQGPISESKITLLKTSNINKIRRWDIIDWKYNVVRVSSDWMMITFDKNIWSIEEISISTPKGLIFNPKTWEPYQNWDIINE